MPRGRVKGLSDEKGCGFMESGDGGEDLSVPYSEVTGQGFRTLEDGNTVEFEIVDGRRGKQASRVEVVG